MLIRANLMYVGKKNGQYLDEYGKPSPDKAKTHIPIKNFTFKEDLYKCFTRILLTKAF